MKDCTEITGWQIHASLFLESEWFAIGDMLNRRGFRVVLLFLFGVELKLLFSKVSLMPHPGYRQNPTNDLAFRPDLGKIRVSGEVAEWSKAPDC